jgi:hypothetical protein
MQWPTDQLENVCNIRKANVAIHHFNILLEKLTDFSQTARNVKTFFQSVTPTVAVEFRFL